ncbi:MAG TPA: sulfotransferase [Solirubrobacterales bacterium]|nr:sulfotransferase [Solirubrobacterales bacterium]
MRDGAQYLASHEDRLAWIMGSSRSGSTWLGKMLGAISNAACIDDPHLGHHLGTWRPISIAWATAADRPELTTLRALKRDHDDYFFSDRYRDAWMPALRDLVRARFGAQLAEQATTEEPHLFVKEPGSQSAQLIFEAFPASRLIFLLRDGRDVVESWLDAYDEGSWAIEGGAFNVSDEGRLPLIRWLSTVWAFRTAAVGRAYERLSPQARVMVRYERLLDDPASELKRICETCGIDCDELETIAEQHRFSRISPAERGSGQAARAASPGGWRESMSVREQRAMHEIMGPTLARLGYGWRQPRAA